jgi:hypothetical protein
MLASEPWSSQSLPSELLCYSFWVLSLSLDIVPFYSATNSLGFSAWLETCFWLLPCVLWVKWAEAAQTLFSMAMFHCYTCHGNTFDSSCYWDLGPDFWELWSLETSRVIAQGQKRQESKRSHVLTVQNRSLLPEPLSSHFNCFSLTAEQWTLIAYENFNQRWNPRSWPELKIPEQPMEPQVENLMLKNFKLVVINVSGSNKYKSFLEELDLHLCGPIWQSLDI